LAEERYCAAIDELLPFRDVTDESDTDEAADLARRANDDLPGAYFGCGELRQADGQHCDAVGPFASAAEVGYDGAARAVNQARYDCGTARADAGEPCEAIGSFEEVDGGGLVRRAESALRGAILDCGVARFRDRDHDGAREQ